MTPLPEAIFRKWQHSFEEDREGMLVYRPENYDFPRARGRDGIEFGRDGNFTEWLIGANDAQRGIRGRWEDAGPQRVRISYEEGSHPKRLLEIVQCDSDVLKVRENQ